MCDIQVRQSKIVNDFFNLYNQAWSTTIHASQERTLYQKKLQQASYNMTHIDHAYHDSAMNF